MMGTRTIGNTKHGHCFEGEKSPTYLSWQNMLQRCTNPNTPKYGDYGGRGIKVCKRWRVFENFLEDMGERPPGKTLDRRDNNGNYTKNNCRWATKKTQSNNTRSAVKITYAGKIRTRSEWSAITGISNNAIRARLAAGWSVKAALTTPAIKKAPAGVSLTYKGQTKTIVEWSKQVGISPTAVRKRLALGWSLKDTLTKKRHS